ncbi:MAG: class I SAM-dependent methyltransferase [Candidatus Hydrogenedentota bacterium]
MLHPIIKRGIYFLRDLFARKMFDVMRRYCSGDVLDVGGWDFYLTAKKKGITCDSWTSLEYDENKAFDCDDEKYTLVHGDGCAMDFDDESYDVVLNIQVLEHVFEPIRMVEEIHRVLKRGGTAIFLIPQTTPLHMVPDHYYNFTYFWVTKVMERTGFEIVELHPLGGRWMSMASHLFYFIYHVAIRKLKSPTGGKRSLLFFLLFPFMVLYALINFPLCLLLGLGDLQEEANNHLVVVRKPDQKTKTVSTTRS